MTLADFGGNAARLIRETTHTKRPAKQVKYHGGFGETALPPAGRDGSPSRPLIPPVSVSKWYYSWLDGGKGL